VHVISGVSGEGISTVLRAMAREINARRKLRAQEAEYDRPTPVPRTRAERQSRNFNAPVVPQPRVQRPEPVKVTPVVKAVKAPSKTAAVKSRANGLAQAKARTAKATAKTEVAVAKPKPKAKTGKAKAKPKTAKLSNKARAKKKARR